MPLRQGNGRALDIEASLGGGGLDIPPIGQEQTNWCWAACMQMVLTKLGNAVQQCSLADSAHGQRGCCGAPSSRLCNKPVKASDIASEWRKHIPLPEKHDAPL